MKEWKLTANKGRKGTVNIFIYSPLSCLIYSPVGRGPFYPTAPEETSMYVFVINYLRRIPSTQLRGFKQIKGSKETRFFRLQRQISS